MLNLFEVAIRLVSTAAVRPPLSLPKNIQFFRPTAHAVGPWAKRQFSQPRQRRKLVSRDGDGEPHDPVWFSANVMAAMDAKELPAVCRSTARASSLPETGFIRQFPALGLCLRTSDARRPPTGSPRPPHGDSPVTLRGFPPEWRNHGWREPLPSNHPLRLHAQQP